MSAVKLGASTRSCFFMVITLELSKNNPRDVCRGIGSWPCEKGWTGLESLNSRVSGPKGWEKSKDKEGFSFGTEENWEQS